MITAYTNVFENSLQSNKINHQWLSGPRGFQLANWVSSGEEPEPPFAYSDRLRDWRRG